MKTTAEDYRKSIQKEITLPSGSTFTIRKVNARDLVNSGIVPFKTANELQGDKNIKEKSEMLWERMTPEQKKQMQDYNDMVIIRGVVSPALSLNGAGDTLAITELTDDDWSELSKEINEFSYGGSELKPFRAESEHAVDPGHGGEAVRQAPVATPADIIV